MAKSSSSILDAESAVRLYYRLVDDSPASDALIELFDTAAVYRRPGYEPMVGREALSIFYRGQRVIRTGRHSLDVLLVAGCRASVQGTFVGSLKSGRAISLRFADFFDFSASGLIVERNTYFFTPMV